jgi:hypothetical protein
MPTIQLKACYSSIVWQLGPTACQCSRPAVGSGQSGRGARPSVVSSPPRALLLSDSATRRQMPMAAVVGPTVPRLPLPRAASPSAPAFSVSPRCRISSAAYSYPKAIPPLPRSLLLLKRLEKILWKVWQLFSCMVVCLVVDSAGL